MSDRYIPRVRCTDCGRFISFSDTKAVCDFTPLQEGTDEACEWTCGKCAEKSGELENFLAEADEVVWLRDLDGTGSMHVCMPHDPGAIPYYREGCYE